MYDQQQPFRNAVKRVVPLVSDADMHPLYIRFRHHSDENFPKVMAGDWTLEYMRAHRISQSLKDLDYPHITEEDGLLFQKFTRKNLIISACMRRSKTLDFLKEKNVPLGIITNGPTDHQTKTEATSIEQLDSFPQYAHFSSNRFPKTRKRDFSAG